MVLQPVESFPYAEFDWDLFSVIGLGADPTRRFHNVATDYFNSVVGCIQKAMDRGHQRIGFILPEVMAGLRYYREIGTFLAFREFNPDTKFYFLRTNSNSAKTRHQWIEKNSIEVIISNTSDFARDRNNKLLPFLDINVIQPGSKISGFYHSPQAIGANLIHQLHGLIILGEKGMTKVPSSVQIAGIWNEGNTL